MRSDVTLALRQFSKSPGFVAVAVLTLAVAIGVNSAVFSLVNAVLLRPAVSLDPDRVVCVYTASRDGRRAFRQFSHAEFQALRASHEVFADVAALNFSFVGVGRDQGFHRAFAFMVSENYFTLMGVTPIAGRMFTAAEARPNAGRRVAIAGYSLWQRSGGSPAFVGSTIQVNGHPYTVVGIAPEGFSGLTSLIAPDLWLPFGVFADVTPAFGDARTPRDLADAATYTVNLVGRMQPGLTIASARPRLPALDARLAAVRPDSQLPMELLLARPFNISPTPGDPGPLRIVSLLLLGMSGLVLLVASLNLANMMLARSASRVRDMAVRRAIGASRLQIVRHVCVEGLVLAVAGGALGLLLSVWANALLRDVFVARLASMGFTLTASVQPDLRIVAATFGFCLLATLAFSLGPALNAARLDLVRDLKTEAGEPAVAGRWTRFFSARHVLVMGQLTLSTALIFAAGLFVRTASEASGTGAGTGFDSGGVIVAELDFSLAGSADHDAVRRLLGATQRVRTLPGIQEAGLSTLVPYTDGITVARVVPAAASNADPDRETPNGVTGISSSMTPGYLASLGVRILRGRSFTDSEAHAAGPARVCLVDEGMAARLFPNDDAVGRLVRITDASAGQRAEAVIVGVVARSAHGLEDKASPVPNVYLPLGSASRRPIFLVARSDRRGPAALSGTVALVREQLQRSDPDLPIVQLLPLDDFMEKNFTLGMVRLGAVMFGVFGAIALLLAIVGVYGVKAYAAASRTREIGIRMALGAGRGHVFALVMRQAIQQAALAVTAGALLSFVVGRALAAVFFQLDAMDPVVLAASTAILSSATLLACAIPARRATRVSPLAAIGGR